MSESGQLWAGRYRIEREIGSGGYAKVFMATQVGVDRQVALKIIDMNKVVAKGADPANAVERFKREASMIAGLTSIHTVTLHDYGVSPEGYPFMALEYVDGDDLEVVIAREGAQPHERVERMLRGVLESLSEAHSHKLLHRDVKPGNIIRSADMRGREIYKLLDFGVAKMLEPGSSGNLTHEDQLVGTPRYMSPEQIMKPGEMTGSSDVYSLGLVAYEMLTGRPATTSTGVTGLLAEQIQTDSFRLTTADRVDVRIASVVNAMLEKDPARRFASAESALGALDAGVSLQAPSAPSAPPESLPVVAGKENPAVVVVHSDGIGSTSFRFSVGAYMVIGGMGWLAMVKPTTAFAQAIGPAYLTTGMGAVTLGYGAFCFLPMFWTWANRDVNKGIHTVGRVFWGLMGSILSVLGLVGLGVAAIEIFKGDILMSGIGLAFGLMYSVAAVALLKPVWDASPKVARSLPDGDAPSNVVLKIAHEQMGRVTALEVAAKSTLHYKAAEQELKRLVSEQMCEERVTRSGASFFYFRDFAKADAKHDFLDESVILGLSDESLALTARFDEVEEWEAKG